MGGLRDRNYDGPRLSGYPNLQRSKKRNSGVLTIIRETGIKLRIHALPHRASFPAMVDFFSSKSVVGQQRAGEKGGQAQGHVGNAEQRELRSEHPPSAW